MAAKHPRKKRIWAFVGLSLLLVLLFFACLFIGSSSLGFAEGWKALFGRSTAANNRIMLQIRLPRAIAALLAGAGLSVAGLVMQTCLGNDMASPSTLGVSNAAVFGANLSIIGFAGGFLETGNNVANYTVSANPYATSLLAFVFAIASVLVILVLCSVRRFSPSSVVLAGIAIGSIWTAATSVLQFYATDVGLSAAVIWTFGDLGRATYRTDLIMAVVLVVALAYFALRAWGYNALLSGSDAAKGLGVNVTALRFVSLALSSFVTAITVSFLGIIGFVGIICPHSAKRLFGEDHRFSLPSSALLGAILVLFADGFGRLLGSGSALPVGAITSLLGAPFFLYLIFAKKKEALC